MLMCSDWSRAMENMKMHNRYVCQEAIVLAHIKCALQQKNLKEGTYEAAGVTFSIQGETTLQIIVFSPHRQYLEVEIVDQMVDSYQAFYPDENEVSDEMSLRFAHDPSVTLYL